MGSRFTLLHEEERTRIIEEEKGVQNHAIEEEITGILEYENEVQNHSSDSN